MKREKQLVYNTLILFIGNFISSCGAIITLPLYTAYLTKEEYGIYDLISVLMIVFVPVITLQIQQAGFRKIVEEKTEQGKNKVISNIIIFSCPIAVVMVTISSLFIQGEIYIRCLISIYLLLEVFIDIIRQIVRGLGKNKEYSISGIVIVIVNVTLSVLFIYKVGLGFLGLILSMIISTFLGFVYLANSIKLFKRIDIKQMDMSLIRESLKFSAPLVPNKISMWILNLSDRLIISFCLGVEATAVYAVANKIPSLLSQAYNPFNLAWQESASKEIENEGVENYYSQVMEKLIDLLFSIMIFIIAFMPMIFKLLIDEQYMDSYHQMPILVIGVMFSCISGFYGGIYLGIKKTGKLSKSTILAAISNLLIHLSLIRALGLYAASISTLLSFFIISIYRGMDIQKELKLKYNFVRILWGSVATIVLLLINSEISPIRFMLAVGIAIPFLIIFNFRIIVQLVKRYLVAKK